MALDADPPARRGARDEPDDRPRADGDRRSALVAPGAPTLWLVAGYRPAAPRAALRGRAPRGRAGARPGRRGVRASTDAERVAGPAGLDPPGPARDADRLPRRPRAAPPLAQFWRQILLCETQLLTPRRSAVQRVGVATVDGMSEPVSSPVASTDLSTTCLQCGARDARGARALQVPRVRLARLLLRRAVLDPAAPTLSSGPALRLQRQRSGRIALDELEVGVAGLLAHRRDLVERALQRALAGSPTSASYSLPAASIRWPTLSIWPTNFFHWSSNCAEQAEDLVGRPRQLEVLDHLADQREHREERERRAEHDALPHRVVEDRRRRARG